MNERIQELIQQSFVTKAFPGPFHAAEEPRYFVEFDKEKFAELIVRECAKVGSQSMYPDSDPDYVGRKIRTYFEVE